MDDAIASGFIRGNVPECDAWTHALDLRPYLEKF